MDWKLKSKVLKAIQKVVGVGLFTVPFIFGYSLFSFLKPTGFWETAFTLLLTLIIGIPLGIFTWIIGYVFLF